LILSYDIHFRVEVVWFIACFELRSFKSFLKAFPPAAAARTPKAMDSDPTTSETVSSVVIPTLFGDELGFDTNVDEAQFLNSCSTS
jgi:hypothetical protein